VPTGRVERAARLLKPTCTYRGFTETTTGIYTSSPGVQVFLLVAI